MINNSETERTSIFNFLFDNFLLNYLNFFLRVSMIKNKKKESTKTEKVDTMTINQRIG